MIALVHGGHASAKPDPQTQVSARILAAQVAILNETGVKFAPDA
ncbi:MULTISPECIES: hypothetical protein [Chelativorans]|jgi:hypothetical protein|nr:MULTISPECIES: hypothetical protein [Chelativorans]